MSRAVCAKILILLVTAWSSALSADQGAPRSGPDPVTAALADKTIRFASDEYGAGVQFFASNGSTYLWFPGQIEIAEGRWLDSTIRVAKLAPRGSKLDFHTTSLVCFKFDGTPRAKLTGKPFGPHECFRLDNIKSATQESADGDVLKLKSGKVPCRACRSDMPLARLRNRVGG